MIALRALRRKLARARELSLSDWAVVAESWWELLCADIAVSVRPYARWRERVAPPPSAGTTAATPATPVDDRLVEMFRIAARHHTRPMSCLRRAIALRAVLERRGYDVALRFGVRRVDDRLDAHAWLTVGGAVVDAGDNARTEYVPLDPVEQGAAR